jgi:hypothetical protein
MPRVAPHHVPEAMFTLVFCAPPTTCHKTHDCPINECIATCHCWSIAQATIGRLQQVQVGLAWLDAGGCSCSCSFVESSGSLWCLALFSQPHSTLKIPSFAHRTPTSPATLVSYTTLASNDSRLALGASIEQAWPTPVSYSEALEACYLASRCSHADLFGANSCQSAPAASSTSQSAVSRPAASHSNSYARHLNCIHAPTSNAEIVQRHCPQDG